MHVYLDNCCFNRPYDDQSQLKIYLETQAKLELQHQIKDGKIELVTSYILELENAMNPFESKVKDISAFLNTYAKVYVNDQSEKKVQELAKEIMKTGVKLMDACHVACAILAGSDMFFTTDKRLLKYQNDRIKILNPVEYIVQEEDNENEYSNH